MEHTMPESNGRTRDPFHDAYLRLTLEIDRVVEGYVDAYLGPPELKAEVAGLPSKSPDALLDDLARVREMAPDDDPDRAACLGAVFRSMDCLLRMQRGEEFDYPDEVARLFDVRAERVDESVFEAAHNALDTALPPGGSLAERLHALRETYEITDGDRVLELLELAREVTQRRTRAIVDLVEGEGIEIALTQGQLWSAYNWYQGNGRSLIEVNTDIPVSVLDMLDTLAHEAYPGHHTELQLKEQRLYRGLGYPESACALLLSPAAAISEGIAETAREIIFPGREAVDWTVDVLLPVGGLPPAVPADLYVVEQAGQLSRRVRGNAALLYHGGQIDEAGAVDYLRTYALATEARARQAFSFIANPLYRAYVFTYTAGYDLIAGAAGEGDKLPVFKRLLLNEVSPSSLAPAE
jgi:hypothetical protein